MKKLLAVVLIFTFVLGFNCTSFAVEPWRDAYAEILRGYMKNPNISGVLLFVLQDIDRDGTPELIVVDRDDTDVTYTFRGNKAISLEYGERVSFLSYLRGAARTNIYEAPNNSPGIIVTIMGPTAGSFGVTSYYQRVVIDGNRLIADASGEHGVDLDVLHEMFDNFGHDADDATLYAAIEENTYWHINDKPVTSEEFNRVFTGTSNSYYDESKGGLGGYDLSEGNIIKVIYGGQSPYVPTSSNPHYYASALAGFMKEPGTDATAILVDLDNDGFEEMVAYKFIYDGDDEYSERGQYVLNVYGVQNGKNVFASIQEDGGYGKISSMYISDKNCIITYLGGGDGTEHHIYEYKDGKLIKTLIFEDANWHTYSGMGHSINHKGVTKKEFDDYCMKIGFDHPKKTIIKEKWDNNRQVTEYFADNDTAKILAMTATTQPTTQSNSTNAEVVVTVILNNQPVNFGDVPAQIVEGRTMVPFRALGDIINAKTTWKEGNSEVEMIYNGRFIRLTIGSNLLTYGNVTIDGSGGYKYGSPNTMIVEGGEPIIVNGRTLVSLRVVSEAFGATVQWVSSTKTVFITYEE